MAVADRPLLFYTAPLAYQGEHRLSVARERETGESTDGLAFAPSWELLTPHIRLRQQGLETEESWQHYASAYRDEMRISYRQQLPTWKWLLSQSRAVLCCFCDLARHPGRCHRLLLAEILKKCGAVYLGELDPGDSANRYAHWLDMGAAEGRAR